MKLVLGTVQFGLDYGINNSGGKLSYEKVFEILNTAFLEGITELDTADLYGDATDVIADYLSKMPANKFNISSKFVVENGISFSESFEKSCRRIGVSSLYGYYFHRFLDFKKFEAFDEVEELKRRGLLSKLGVSLYSIEELETAVNSEYVDIIQLPFNIFDRSEVKIELLKKAKSKNKLIYSRSVFLQGLFFKKTENLPESLIPLKENLEQLSLLVSKYNTKMEDLCLRFVAGLDFIDKVLIGVDSVVQLNQNLSAMQLEVPENLIKEVSQIKIYNEELLNPASWNC